MIKWFTVCFIVHWAFKSSNDSTICAFYKETAVIIEMIRKHIYICTFIWISCTTTTIIIYQCKSACLSSSKYITAVYLNPLPKSSSSFYFFGSTLKSFTSARFNRFLFASRFKIPNLVSLASTSIPICHSKLLSSQNACLGNWTLHLPSSVFGTLRKSNVFQLLSH